MVHWLEQHLSPCFFKLSTGLDCPGCGMQRAFIALLKGNLSDSIHYHPALIPFIITILALILQLFVKHPFGGKIIMWLFIITSGITAINFVLKFIVFLNNS